jgi:hypothetical protein
LSPWISLPGEDVAAAAAAHHELGRDHDDAVAECLVERIGAEIGKRVDARLGPRGEQVTQRSPDSQLRQADRPSWPVIVLGLGSMAIGVEAAHDVLNIGRHFGPYQSSTAIGGAQVGLVVLIWIIIGVINLA